MNKIKYQIGAHLSASRSYSSALEEIIKIGGNCLQIFSSSPLMWKTKLVSENLISDFKTKKAELNIKSVYFHAPYLINLADKDLTGEKSVKALIHELDLCSKLGVKGSIIHTGSFKNKNNDISCRNEKNYPILISNIHNILKQTPKDTLLILENSGTRKIGQTIDQLSEIIKDIHDERLRVCLDTCHLHASGYDLSSEKDFNIFLNHFDKKIGLHKLEVIHLNDSRDDFGSLRDRHENIGYGKVGLKVFSNFLNDERTKNLPFILEVPGINNKGPDKENIDIVKNLIN
jgi:deoxyribonuclease-4